jgi:hypothetical protein
LVVTPQKGGTKGRQDIQKRALLVESLRCGEDDCCLSMKRPPSMQTAEVVFTMLLNQIWSAIID